jgi:hypothetical protein
MGSLRSQLTWACFNAITLVVCDAAAAQDDERPNVIAVAGGVAWAFPDIGDPVLGLGPSLSYERALIGPLSVSPAVSLTYVPDAFSDNVGVSAGLALPIYFTGRAPAGPFVAPGAAFALAPEFAAGGGLSLGYQHIFASGLVLGASAGASLTFVQHPVDETVPGVGMSAAVGYAF